MLNMRLLFVLLFAIAHGESSSEDLIVTVPNLGRVQGSRMLSHSGRIFNAFRGIRYGRAPVGKLRFQDPLAAEPWEGTFDAGKEGPACTQFHLVTRDVFGIEDCLRLNIYVPQIQVDGTDSTLLPILVWIHGGAYFMGSGNGESDIFGPLYMMDRDIVLVTINYRLGPLGFLSTEDAEAPGNYGLLDQSLALRWIQNHITHFGGNPSSVTIAGESAGAASVQFHMLSPYSRGLFHGAIAQSGATSCPWAMEKTVKEYSYLLAEHLDCPTNGTTGELMSCLRERKAEDIAGYRKSIWKDIMAFGMYPVAFTPRVDIERRRPFLPAAPEKIIAAKKFNMVPLITGVTANEGAIVVASLLLNESRAMKQFESDPVTYTSYALSMEKRPDGHEIAKRALDQYCDKAKPYGDQIIQLEQLTADFCFAKCVDNMARSFAKYSDEDVYYYYYNYRGQQTLPVQAGAPAEPDLGVCHGDELFLLFSSTDFHISTTTDLKVSKTLLDLWTSFVDKGTPKSENSKDTWLPLIKDRQMRYLNIDANPPTLVDDDMPFHSRIQFWEDLLASSSFRRDEL